ncbi:MAG: hypothetical protein AB7E55_15205, partial [Pigmentiphaga sp.]
KSSLPCLRSARPAKPDTSDTTLQTDSSLLLELMRKNSIALLLDQLPSGNDGLSTGQSACARVVDAG